MSDGHGEPNTVLSARKESVAGANVASDSPVTDPGQVRGGTSDAAAAGKFEGQRGKSGALKKSARYRSRSLSASSADSYSSTSYTGEFNSFKSHFSINRYTLQFYPCSFRYQKYRSKR